MAYTTSMNVWEYLNSWTQQTITSALTAADSFQLPELYLIGDTEELTVDGTPLDKITDYTVDNDTGLISFVVPQTGSLVVKYKTADLRDSHVQSMIANARSEMLSFGIAAEKELVANKYFNYERNGDNIYQNRIYFRKKPVLTSFETLRTIIGTGAPQVITTLITDPSVPMIVSITTSTSATLVADSIIISGTNNLDEAVTDTIAYTDSPGTFRGSVIFKTVSSITVPATFAATDTVVVKSNGPTVELNLNASTSTESWKTLEEGYGKDFLFESDLSRVTFLKAEGYSGFKNVRASFTFGFTATEYPVEHALAVELATATAALRVTSYKVLGNDFATQDSIRIAEIAITKAGGQVKQTLESQMESIRGIQAKLGAFEVDEI